MSSVAYWYAKQPTMVASPPEVKMRMPVLRDNHDKWLYDKDNQVPGKPVELNDEMRDMKAKWARRAGR